MAERDQAGSKPAQNQESRQSAQQGALTGSEASPHRDRATPSGIGSSQGQDRRSREEQAGTRPSAGTADVERGADTPGNSSRGGGSEESLVNESTGAFKERP